MESRTTKRGAAALVVPALLALALGAGAIGCGSDNPGGAGKGGDDGTPPVYTGGSGGSQGGSGGTGNGGSGGEVVEPCSLLSVDPRRGSTSGNERVVVTGRNFRGRQNQKVFFGTNAALTVNSIDGDTILVTTPPGDPGFALVRVENDSGSCECADCFKYQGPVRLDAVTPSEGYLYGGTTVTLTGEGLRGEMIVLFGDRRAFDVTENPDGSLTAVTPPGDAEGGVDVKVFDADGHDTLRRSFTYRDRVVVDRVDPPGGPIAGGNHVTLHGRGFGSGLQVLFGGAEALAIPNPDGSLDVTVPRGAAAGAVDVEVRTAAGTGVRAGAYAYFDPSDTSVQLFAVAPGRGPLGGGNPAVLVGSGLDAGQLIARFGGVPAGVDQVDPHFVEVAVPAGSAPGAVDVSVRVTTGGGTLDRAYEYVNPLQVTAVAPATGPEEGGTAIDITGVRFPAAVKVYVGAFEATNVVRVSDTQITAVTPRGTDGTVPVRVVEDGDPDNEGVLDAAFAYEGTFSFLRIDPSTGSRAGGTRVELMGTGFRSDLLARFGATDAVKMEIENPYTAIAVTPRGEVGTVDVFATEALGSDVLGGAFSYFNPASTAGGSSGGALRGTLNVTVLDGGRTRFGLPLPDSLVIVGTDDSTALRCEKNGTLDVQNCLTDDRGQITFSDASLVKAQVVSVSHFGYEHTTVVNQSAENLTVYLQPNFEPGQCEDQIDNDGDGGIDEGTPLPPDGDGKDETGPRGVPDGRPDDADPSCTCGPDLEPEGMEHLCVCTMIPVEQTPCCDGLDNDGDSLIDAEDPDCGCTQGFSEGPLPQCGDCKDNDGDGLIDGPPGLAPPDPACPDKGGDDERGGRVTGRVFGFKAPRPLALDETEIAFVSFSVPSVYSLAAGFARSSFTPQQEITADGGTFLFEFPGRQQIAMYAVYGIKKANAFEPVLMGITRGITTEPGRPVSADIILDMHLDMQVQVNLENSPARDLVTEVLTFLDVGKDGVILLRQGMNVRSAAVTAQAPDSTTVKYMPRLSGESFVFQVASADPNIGLPFMSTFRRQPGSLDNGVTVGPLMGITRIVTPPDDLPLFDGVIEWASLQGPDPEVSQIQVLQPTLAGPIPRWTIVLPGKEKRVAVPDATMAELRKAIPAFTQLNIFVTTAREPRFAFDQWTYDNLSFLAFTSFAQHGVATFLAP